MAFETHQARAVARQHCHGFPSESDLVTVQFWMNGCAQVAQVNPSELTRYRHNLLATGAVLLN